jgi:hypothetical protein
MTYRNQLTWLACGVATLSSGLGCTLQDTTGDLHSAAGAAGMTQPGTQTAMGGNATTLSSTNTSAAEVGGAAAVGATGGVSSTLPLEVANPSGDCGMHYFSDYRWLPDCNLPIKRSYYRLLLTMEGIPMIHPELPAETILAACDDSTSPIRTEATHTGICREGENVPRLTVTEGMTLVHYLNQQLRFSVGALNSVVPEPIYERDAMYGDTNDGVDICMTFAEARSGILAPVCQTILAWHDTRRPTLSLSQEQATQLAQYLNRLYGVDGAAPVSDTCTVDTLKDFHVPECPRCLGGGSETNACSLLGLRCTYNMCDTCSCVETLTSGGVPALVWDCAFCLF